MTVPSWAAAAINASEARHREELRVLRETSLAEHEGSKREAIERAVRIFEYRQVRLDKRIRDESEWIDAVKASADPKKAKILPAREGKLRKQMDSLRELRDAHEQELVAIESRQIAVSSKVWSISVLTPR